MADNRWQMEDMENSKHETLNSKHDVLDFGFEVLDLFRISDLEFRIYNETADSCEIRRKYGAHL